MGVESAWGPDKAGGLAGSGSSSPRVTIAAWRPGAATWRTGWLPAAALAGALLTLAALSMGGGIGMRLTEFGRVPDTHHLATADAAAGGAAAAAAQQQQQQQQQQECPPPPRCKACPEPKACPPAPQCPKPEAAQCPPCPAASKAAAAGAAGRGAAAAKAAAAGADLEGWAARLRVPWGPALTEQEAARGLTYYGSGERLGAVVDKLMAGKPIKVFTLGASVTRGIGTVDRKNSYANRLFEYIAHVFPHRGHVFVNRGIGGTSSSIFSVCAEHLVDDDADLVVLEFSANDKRDAPFSDPERKGYEQLARKLLRLPGRPALIQLHHYAWWHAVGDGIEDGGLFYHPASEAQLGVLANYYDFPQVSVRAAMWRLMRARAAGFNPDKARGGPSASPTDVLIAGAEPGSGDKYWYKDRTHPADEGHGMLAELLAHVLARAVLERVAPRPRLHLPAAVRQGTDLSEVEDDAGLPPPMIPGNAAAPTTLCAIDESFEDVAAKRSKGWQYKPQRPQGSNWAEQKWGWVANQPGEWLELEFDSASGFEDLGGNETAAQVSLSYLRSYRGMGTAELECVSGCECQPQALDGTWAQEVSLQQILQFEVSRDPRCRLRVTVSERPGGVPQQGHKVLLQGIMVSHFSVRLNTYVDQVDVLTKTTVKSAP